ncbi:hypothetical protein ABZ498_24840 [Streptomyces lavendulocolor]|uniref:hypothetical protein n=1 Tax=Streptomyces lavendulocolor TaxID=67316 RepID=UPI0033CE9CBD
MGEQRPLDALTGFVRAGLPPDRHDDWHYFSRPDIVTDSYESRRFLAPATTSRPQTEFFEYHWAHLMQGNRLGDLVPTLSRLLFKLPWVVPAGLRGAWLLLWAVIIGGGIGLWFLLSHDAPEDQGLGERITEVLLAVIGGGIWAVVLPFLLAAIHLLARKLFPRVLTNSFVDVVRYLDTSPRSYAVRHDIRKGFVELLERLHTSERHGKFRYQRIIIVAHSLGAYIAYDGISHLWATMNTQAAANASGRPTGLLEIEAAAQLLGDELPTSDQRVTAFQRAQGELWLGNRTQGNRWLITDFVSVGTPMYFADLLYTRTRSKFRNRVQRRELPTCPPQNEEQYQAAGGVTPHYTYHWRGREVLYDGAPFAVVRWTNLWFPAWPGAFGFFGDWFGGPLQRLFGYGVRDVPVRGNKWQRLLPAIAHALYFKFPDNRDGGSITWHLQKALDLGGFNVSATAHQLTTVFHLLDRAGLSTRKLTERHADFVEFSPTWTGQRVIEWLGSLTQPEIANVIDDLHRHQGQ